MFSLIKPFVVTMIVRVLLGVINVKAADIVVGSTQNCRKKKGGNDDEECESFQLEYGR